MRIVVFNHLTLDGVAQGPGRPDEDTRGGFAHGGWSLPYADPVLGRYVAAGMREAQEYVDHLRKSNSSLLGQSVVASAVSRLQSQESEFSRDEESLKTLVKHAEDVRQTVSGVVNNNSATMAEIGQAGQALQHMIDESTAASKNLAWADAENRLGSVEASLRSSLVGVPRAVLRTALIALVLPALARDADGRGWHDRAADTVVVRTRG